jgi:23S rRNA pseudouridine1911/1915/1917 synthase
MVNRQNNHHLNPSVRKSLVNENLVVLDYHERKAKRLDKYLVECLPDYSRSRLQAFIKSGKVMVDGQPARKTGQILEGRVNIVVHIPPPAPSEIEAEAIPLDIIFENENLLVVNKPAGMVVHPSAGHNRGTLVHAALAHAPDIAGVGGKIRPGVVHRLDKQTSGLILLAKNDAAHQWLQNQFRSRQVEKEYIALVDGKPPTQRGRIEAAIGRDQKMRKIMAVRPPTRGRPSISEYRTIESFNEHTLLEVHPITGRTHQIRVHLAFIGCPVVGDTVYGRKHSSLPLNRHFLHAARLVLRLPGDEQVTEFNAPMPMELIKILNQLRAGL